MRKLLITTIVMAATTNLAPGDTWPGSDWATATSESQGMSGSALEQAAAYAGKFGGGSGCIIRHGFLVKEWGDAKRRADIKSATKGSLGTTMLGLALDGKLVQLDDAARKHYPAIGAEKTENVATGWLDEIRIGYLYLREGEWNGQRILSKGFIRLATRPTDLPSFVPYYAFYWGSNARGTYPEIPRDAYWALGLGDSFVLVCPSLDIVAVRLGVGSTKSQLPGGDKPDEWGRRVAGFFKLVVAAVNDTDAGTTKSKAAAPYPPSDLIVEVRWAPKETVVRHARGSDNWPMTWASDDALYTAYGDGRGFEPFVPGKLSLGFAKVTGTPRNLQGVNVRSATGERAGDGVRGVKASGLLSVNGRLYLWARNATNSQLAWSADGGRAWTWADWRFTTSFGCPTFVNFGRDHSGARDEFVYVYSHDSDSAYTPADRFVLARVSRERLPERAAYEFFEGIDAQGRPRWTKDIDKRGAVFAHTGRCYRSGITYNAGLKRYLWCQTLPGGDARFAGGFGIYDAPEPWGPWTTAFFTDEWDIGPGETQSFPTKWMSADGRNASLVFSGDDCFSVRGAELICKTPAK